MHVNKSSGFTLVELVMGISLSTLVIMGASYFLSQQSSMVKNMESSVRMASVANAIERVLSNPAYIRASALYGKAEGNQRLKECINSVKVARETGTMCDATNPMDQVSFDFLIPTHLSQNPTDAEIEAAVIAGETSNPALYKIKDGTSCPRNSKDASCNLLARVYFWATCPAEAALRGAQGVHDTEGNVAGTSAGSSVYAQTTCLSALAINIRFQIVFVQDPSLPESQRIRNMKNIPPDSVFWTDKERKKMSTFGAITIPVSTIPGAAYTNIQCPPNSSIVGIQNGVPKCECRYPFREAAGCVPGEPCACVALPRRCAENERYRGLDLNGDIICCPVTCQQIIVDGSTGVNGCRSGWIEAITPVVPAVTETGFKPGGSCMATKSCPLGKWGGSCETEVICKEMFKCCYETGSTKAGCNSGS